MNGSRDHGSWRWSVFPLCSKSDGARLCLEHPAECLRKAHSSICWFQARPTKSPASAQAHPPPGNQTGQSTPSSAAHLCRPFHSAISHCCPCADVAAKDRVAGLPSADAAAVTHGSALLVGHEQQLPSGERSRFTVRRAQGVAGLSSTNAATVTHGSRATSCRAGDKPDKPTRS